MRAPRRALGWSVETAWLPLFLAPYFGVIAFVGLGITTDTWDGLLGIMNSVYLGGSGRESLMLLISRPPIGCILLAPWTAWAYGHWGPLAAIKASHVVMPCFLVALLWVCHKVYVRLTSPLAAACAALSMAFNPILIRYAPLALFDIYSALAGIPFLWAAYRALQLRTPSSYWTAMLAYVFAVLSRYQLCILVLGPLACIPLIPEPGGLPARLRRWLSSPFWLMPPAGYFAAIVFIGGLVSWTSGGNIVIRAWEAHQDLFHNIFLLNVSGKEAASWTTYLVSLWRQLGTPLSCVAALGLCAWLRRRRGEDLYLAVSLIVLLGVMSLAINNKEQRYVVSLLPLVYAALAQGVETLLAWLPRNAWRRAALAAAWLGLFPWAETLASWRFLRKEPSLYTLAPWRMAEVLQAGTEADGCIRWSGGSIMLHSGLDVIDKDEQMPMIDTPILGFLTRGRVQAQGGRRAGECRPTMAVDVMASQRESLLARIYELAPGSPAARRVLRWEMFGDDLRPALERRARRG